MTATNQQDPAVALANVEMKADALADPGVSVDNIQSALDYLYENGADEGAITLISESAAALVATVEKAQQSLQAALELAHTFQAQREAALQTLADLKVAIEDADTSVPEVEALYSDLLEMAEEDSWMYLQEFTWETLYERARRTTGWSPTATRELVDFLTDEVAPHGHRVWDALRQWLRDSTAILEAEDAR